VVDSFRDPRSNLLPDGPPGDRARRLAVVRRAPDAPELEALSGEEASFRALSERIASLELQLCEQVEIERMRDLELGRLEAELEQKSQRLQAVDDALFHERRRSAELERRWNVLATSYEATAASLVETGATLTAIASQRSYRLAVRLLHLLGRHRRANELVDRWEHPMVEGDPA
jgi:hypothetical protein